VLGYPLLAARAAISILVILAGRFAAIVRPDSWRPVSVLKDFVYLAPGIRSALTRAVVRPPATSNTAGAGWFGGRRADLGRQVGLVHIP